MVKRMLIDATHAEETRVVVMNGTRLEEFDVETSTKKQLKGNIYLAKIVRVEPSLQAAFVDYGGNRHGFLAFSEIHPDYYQIPVADRQALLAEQREVMKHGGGEDADADDEAQKPVDAPEGDAGPAAEAQPVDQVGGEEGEEEERRRPRSLRNYKIQEVIKRRQIVLVQVVKEERGNKGAALTTYLSLAGRYCVLMPNTARGGGVSRKITNPQDRKRLKAITGEMDIPDGMAVIVRTAGSERTKPEIKRDYEYLLRLWDSVRDLTLRSISPALVYEEANLIKRSIRDLYSRDIEEILVDGEEGYRLAKDFMRMLTPSHARRVQLFKDPAMPLFQRYQVESQLDSMHSPVVQLKSGGYLVINQTEALVAIDVNSGRATKERHIEETALKTNCEAADEVARQLRLRDLAGLIVIDFIDMEESRNNHTVERRLKEALRFDRARIQMGKISAFGLMEMSRQRLRPSLMETSFLPCPHCGGTGSVRSVESASMHVLRAIEEEGVRRRSSEVTVTVHSSIALYILNQKRKDLADIEARYGFRVYLTNDDGLIPPAIRMEKVKSETPIEAPKGRPVSAEPVAPEDAAEEEIDVEEIEVETETATETAVEEEAQPDAESRAAPAESDDGEGGRRRRRRRRRRGRREDGLQANEEIQTDEAVVDGPDEETDAEEPANIPADSPEDADDDAPGEGDGADAIQVAEGDPAPRRRRRGKRGGRRRHRRTEGLTEVEADGLPEDAATGEDGVVGALEPAETSDILPATPPADEPATDHPVAVDQTSAPEETPVTAIETADASAPAVAPEAEPEAPAKPKRTRSRKKAVEPAADAAPEASAPAEEPAAKPKRTRATRRKAAAQPVEEAVAPEATVPEAASDVQPEAGQAGTGTPELSAAPDTNRAEDVVMTPDNTPSDAPSQPPRRGWWNR
ncbi:MAG: ribonuclease E/G [Telmatospirillum sp.]|nr:ribonuclease E/G [Telmatospirillum sp.]